MNKFRFTLTAIAIMAFTLMTATSLNAQTLATRTWVSGVGDDANPCSRTAPCKSFAGAISKTAKDGEINALEPGGFGTVTITKSITIDGSSNGEAGILNSSTSGVIVTITSATDVRKSVTLRRLAINGAGLGTQGVNISSGNVAGLRVYVENCLIEGQNGSPGNGITDARSNGGFLEVQNTTILNNSGNGISMVPGTATEGHLHILNSRFQGNGGSGLLVGSNVKATVYDSAFIQNVSAGIMAQQNLGGLTEVAVDHCVVSNNVNGFQANTANTIIRVSNTTAMNNTTLAAAANGGQVSSYGNNQTGGIAFPSAPTNPT